MVKLQLSRTQPIQHTMAPPERMPGHVLSRPLAGLGEASEASSSGVLASGDCSVAPVSPEGELSEVGGAACLRGRADKIFDF